jgi:hypothetical protein
LERWWVTLLRQQQSDGFPDLAGTDVSVTVPVSDRLISRLVAERIPAGVPIREFDFSAHHGERMRVRIRLAKPAFLPPIHIMLSIERQLDLPTNPTLVLKIASQGVASLAAIMLPFVDVLPAGVQYTDGRFIINVRTILERQNAADVLEYLTDVKVTTAEHQVIVRARARLPAAGQ